MRAAMTALAVLSVSCADVVGLDDFHKRAVSESAATTSASEYFGLKLQLVGMKPHIGQYLEYRVIDANNFVQSRGVVPAMTSEDVELVADRAIPRANGPYRLDFFADVNHSGGFDGLGSVITNDHSWRIDPLVENPEKLQADEMVTVTFVHSTTFQNIDQYPSGTRNPSQDTGLGARLHVDGLTPFMGRALDLTVTETRARHVVALYHVMRQDTPALDAVVPGCVDVETAYEVALAIKDAPRDWRVTVTSTDKGLDATIVVGAP